jgi:hypothetical protein
MIIGCFWGANMKCPIIVFFGFIAAFLVGCAGITSPSNEPPAVDTTTMKQSVLADKARIWKDADSIRDASAGPAYACPRRFGAGATCICVEVNAKNSFGGYTGLQKNAVAYRNGVFDAITASDFDDACTAIQPFPELNGNYATPQPAPPKSKRPTKKTG